MQLLPFLLYIRMQMFASETHPAIILMGLSKSPEIHLLTQPQPGIYQEQRTFHSFWSAKKKKVTHQFNCYAL